MTDLVRTNGAEAAIDLAVFNREAGIGITVTDEEIAATLDAIFASHMKDI